MNRHISAKTVCIISHKKSSNASTGALTVAGGVGISKNLVVKEDIKANELIVKENIKANELILNSSAKIKKNLYIDGDLVVKGKITSKTNPILLQPLSRTIKPQIIQIDKDNQCITITQPLVFLEVHANTTITSVIYVPNNSIIRIIIKKYTHADFPILKWSFSNNQSISFEELNDYVELLWSVKQLVFVGGNIKPNYIIL